MCACVCVCAHVCVCVRVCVHVCVCMCVCGWVLVGGCASSYFGKWDEAAFMFAMEVIMQCLVRTESICA